MPTCETCGAHVSDQYVRVFGDSGSIFACLHCAPKNAVPTTSVDRQGEH